MKTIPFIIFGLFISLQALALDSSRIVTKEMQEETKSIAKFFKENPLQVVDDNSKSNEKIFMLTESNSIKFYRSGYAPVILIVHSIKPAIVSVEGEIFYAKELKTTTFLNEVIRPSLYTKLSNYFISEASAEWGGITRDLYEGLARGVEQQVERYETYTGRAGIPARVVQPGDGASMGGHYYDDDDREDYYVTSSTTGAPICYSSKKRKAVSDALCGYTVYRSNDGKKRCYQNVGKKVSDDRNCGYVVYRGNDNKMYCYLKANTDQPVANKFCGYSVFRSTDGKMRCYLSADTGSPVEDRYCGSYYAKSNSGKVYCYSRVSSEEPINNRFCEYSIRTEKDGKDKCYSNAKNKPTDDVLCGTSVRKNADGKRNCTLDISPKTVVAGEVCGYQVTKNKDGQKVCSLKVAPDVSLEMGFCDGTKKAASVDAEVQKKSISVEAIGSVDQLGKKSLTERMNEEFDQYQCLVLNGGQGVSKSDNRSISVDHQGKISLCKGADCSPFSPGNNPNAVLTTREADEVVEKIKLVESSLEQLKESIALHEKVWEREISSAKDAGVDVALSKIETLSEEKKNEFKSACSKISSDVEKFKSNVEKTVELDDSFKIALESLAVKKSDIYCVSPISPKLMEGVLSKTKSALVEKKLAIDEVRLLGKVELLKEYKTCCAEKKCTNSLNDNEKEQKADAKVVDSKRTNDGKESDKPAGKIKETKKTSTK